MNHREYSVVGKNKETNRKRTLKIKAKSEEKAKEMALEQDLLAPLEIKVIPFQSPSEAQLNYAENLNISIPENATSKDVSCLIDKKVSHDSDPNPGLIEFADNRNIFFSYYIGKKRLYNLIFSTLNDVDRTAFFVFSIYRWLSEDRYADLDTHPDRDVFYEFAESVKNDNSFQKSLLKYEGEDLRFFGSINIEDEGGISTYEGGSNRTLAYKKAAEFLQNKFDTLLTKTKILTHDQAKLTRKSTFAANKNASASGCLLSIIVTIVSIILSGLALARAL
jgi:hypothetical protein